MTSRSKNPALRPAALALALALGGALPALAADVTSDQFAPDWQVHSQALLNQGRGILATDTKWLVPGNLPSGDYALANRTKGSTTLIDGALVHVRKSGVNDVYVMLPDAYGDVVAVREQDIPGGKQASSR